jgi:hypothetical protein
MEVLGTSLSKTVSGHLKYRCLLFIHAGHIQARILLCHLILPRVEAVYHNSTLALRVLEGDEEGTRWLGL